MKRLLLLMVISTEIVLAQVWHLKVAGGGLGCPLTYNPLNSQILYGAAGSVRVYISRNGGNTWQLYGNLVPGSGQIKSIAVNPLDTLQLLVGVEMSSGMRDRIMKSTDGGLGWTQTWSGSFSYYGRPVEFKPIHPDTVYTMGDDTLWRSTNFGTTWDTVRTVTGLFSSWCDAEIRSDSANILYVGDASSGIWKTTNYGVNWKHVYSTSGEIPSIAIDPFNPRVAYASRFGGSGIEVGGLLKTTDGGETWNCLNTPIKICSSSYSGNGWWIAPSMQNPGYIYFGTFGANPNGIFVTRDAGASWQNISCGLTGIPILNYGMLAVDTNSVIALQQNGISKLDYTINLRVVSPNGGERLDTASHHTIAWVDTSIQNYYSEYVRVEYSINNGTSWSLIADSIHSFQASYDWIVPSTPSGSCRMRVSDVNCLTIKDESDSNFAIVPGSTSADEIFQVPHKFSLGQNYPNPFNPTTRLSFTVPAHVRVTIKIYTMLGQEIATLVDADEPAGTHNVEWNGTNDKGSVVGNGVYYVRMIASVTGKFFGSGPSEFFDVRKILLVK